MDEGADPVNVRDAPPMTAGRTPTGDALVADAIRLIARRPAGYPRKLLVATLVAKHGFSWAAVSHLIDRAAEFKTAGDAVVYRPLVAKMRNPQNGAAITWDSLSADLLLYLNDPGTDTVHVQVAPSSGEQETSLRCRADFVRKKRSIQIWAAVFVEVPLLRDRLVNVGSVTTLTTSWALPLVPASSSTEVPAVLVWRYSTAREATAGLRAILETQLETTTDRVRFDREECSPGEIERRVQTQHAIRRLRERRARPAAVRTCDRCGQPLSDPVSVQLGIGPECLKYYSDVVIKAIRSPRDAPERAAAKTPSVWLKAIVNAWKPS